MSLAQDIANFNRKLDEAIQQTMETEVFFAAQVAILNAVESEVYQAYNWPYPPSDKPEHYERRYEKGGLADPSNIELVSSGPTGDGWEIEVQNRTRDDISQRLIAPVVETGQGYEWEDSEIYRSEQPRPFHKKAEEIVANEKDPYLSLDGSIARGLRNRGFDVK